MTGNAAETTLIEYLIPPMLSRIGVVGTDLCATCLLKDLGKLVMCCDPTKGYPWQKEGHVADISQKLNI